ncbi:MAG: hypothetical protein KBD90_06575 [Alphaproteobacteria bacterium]|nr:hypothetical protein [Alphaproteobacteria bacterium]
MDQSKRQEKTYELGELQQTYGEDQDAQDMENNIFVAFRICLLIIMLKFLMLLR